MSIKEPQARKHPKNKKSGAPVKEKSRIQKANERKIIDAAIIEFGRHGFRGTTIDEIANRADLSKPNLFYYFKTKNELYVEALNHVLDIWLVPLADNLNPDSDPEEALGAYIQKKMEMSRDYPEASRMFASEIIEGAKTLKPVLETRLAELTKKKKNLLSKWSREGKLARIDSIHLIFMIWAVTQHYADFEAQIKSQTGKTLQDEQFFRDATKNIQAILFRGVLP